MTKNDDYSEAKRSISKISLIKKGNKKYKCLSINKKHYVPLIIELWKKEFIRLLGVYYSSIIKLQASICNI